MTTVIIAEGTAAGFIIEKDGRPFAGATTFEDAVDLVYKAFDRPPLPRMRSGGEAILTAKEAILTAKEAILTAKEAAAVAQVRGLVKKESVIVAVRVVRALSNCGLKDAKDAVEALL